MKPSERYLQQATRGLWGKEKRALRTELQGHLHERSAEFRLGGLSAEEAERQTLRELGTPECVSSGMLGVHTLPAMGKAGALSLLLLTGLFAAVTQGTAQVKSIYSSHPNAAYLDFEQLKAAINEAGGELNGSPNDATVTVPGAPRSMPVNTARWPGATLFQDQKTYLNTDVLLDALLNAGAQLTISGWKNPVIQAGSTRIRIETDDQRIISRLYTNILLTSASELTTVSQAPLAYGSFDGPAKPITFTGNVQENSVYALIVPKFTYWTSPRADGRVEDGFVILESSINQAHRGGLQLQLNKEVQHFKFSSSVSNFLLALDPYLSATAARQWDATHPAPVLLLKLSGQFGRDAFTVVNPNTVHIK